MDPGTVRVGVAVSDAGRVIASPLATIPAGEDLPARLAALARDEACDTAVVGLPRSLSGRDSAAAQRSRRLAAALATAGLHVELHDERLTSAQAERALLEGGARRAARREARDRVAAALLLQGWLDARAPARR